jgi:glyoxylase I family protein
MSLSGDPAAAPITGFSHVQLLVSDVAASERWYRAALGLVPYASDPEIGYVALRHRGVGIVVVLTARPERTGAHDGAPDALDHLAFAVADGGALRAWAEHLEAQGVEHGGVVLENGHPSLQLRDPDGIAIELVAP